MNEDRNKGQGQADFQKRDQQQGGGLGQDHKQHQQGGDPNRQQQGGSNDRSDIQRDLGKDDLGKARQGQDQDRDRSRDL